MIRSEISRVRILEKHEPKFYSKPNVVIGLPEAGLVGTIASSYLVEALSLEEIGYVDSGLEPPVMVVEKSEPKYPIRIFGRDDLVVFVSSIPLSSRLAIEFSTSVVNWCLGRQSKLLIGVTGLPSAQRLELQQEVPRVFYVASERQLSRPISSVVETFQEGLVVGTYASILKTCMLSGQPNITLLAESHLEFPDPGAAAAIIGVLKTLLSVDINVKPLLEESEQIRLKMRELMKRTQQSLQGAVPQGPPGVYA